MNYRQKKLLGLVLTIFLFALYSTLPSIGAIGMGNLFIKFLIYFVIYSIIVGIICRVSTYILLRIHCHKIESYIYEEWSDKTFVLTIWGIVLIGWIPAYLAFFPGIFGYDTPNQMQQIMGDIPYSSQQPIFHTIILSLFMKCGMAIFGNYNGGIALFSIMQGIAVSGSIASTFVYSKRLKIPFLILLLSIIWCVWNPVLQVLTFNTTKDILFGVFFLHFVINCYELIVSDPPKKLSRMIFLTLTGFLMCLLRNQGIYVVMVLILISLITIQREKQFLVSLCSIVLISQLFFLTTTHVMNVEGGDVREMLSVPMQQLALVCKLYMDGEPVTLTEEEFDKFTSLVSEEYLSDFHLTTADPIKSHFQTELLKEDLPGYLSLYINVGLHNLGYYMTAFRCLVYPYWNMSRSLARHISITNTFEEITQQWGITQESLMPAYKDYLSDYILHHMEEKKNILSWLLQPGICIWLFTSLFGLAIEKENKALFVSVLTCILLFGTLLLGPVALLRYLYPLMLLTPWLLTMLTKQLESYS